LQKSPVDVWRSEAVERFKSVLNEIDVHKSTLEGILQNGLCQIKDHCLSLRQKVDLAAEQAIEEIQLNREDLMQQIDSYEISTGQTFKNDQLSKDEFERSASECSSFSAQWRAYLKKVRINEEDILNTYDSAVALKTETERKIVQLNTLVFGRKLIDFERGFTTMPGLGQIRHQSLNFCRLDDFECLDISGRVCRAKKIEVLARVDNSFEVFFIDYCNRAVERLTFDKQSSQVVGSDSVRKENYLCLRRIDETAVLTQYTDESEDSYLELLSASDLSVVELLRIDYDPLFISSCDRFVYSFGNAKLNIFDRQLKLIKSIGQRAWPSRPFYFPANIRQFECNNGRYFVLTRTHLRIMREDSGELIRSIEVAANNFIVNSRDGSVVLMNKSKKGLDYYTGDGVLFAFVHLEDFCDDLSLAIAQDNTPIFFNCNKIFFISN